MHFKNLASAKQDGLATEEDLILTKAELKEGICLVKGEIKLNRWMLGLIVTIQVIPYLKEFF